MNRKMRAKVNNAAAKASKERKPCPASGKPVLTSQKNCGSCGSELVPMIGVFVPLDSHKETLH